MPQSDAAGDRSPEWTTRIAARLFSFVAFFGASVVTAAPPEIVDRQDPPPDSLETTNEEQKKAKPGPFSLEPAPLDGPLVTERPGFGDSTEIVPRGHVQFESGYTFTLDKENRVKKRSHNTQELLSRFGIIENLELQMFWSGYTWQNDRVREETDRGREFTSEDWTQGSSDLFMALKTKVLKQDGLIPTLSILSGISVPSGSAPFSSGDVDPETRLIWGYALDETFSVGGNVNLAVPTDGNDRFFQTAASISLGAALTDRLGGFIEYFGIYPNSRNSDCAHSVDGGFTYLLTDNVQLDVSTGVGLNEEAPDFFVGAGIAMRF